MVNMMTEARRNNLEKFVEESGVEVEEAERNEFLEEWFVQNPVERIVVMEKAIREYLETARSERRKVKTTPNKLVLMSILKRYSPV